MVQIFVSTEIELSAVAPNDAGELFALVDRNRAHLRKWLPWLDFNTSVEDSSDFIDRSIQQWDERSALVTVIRYEGTMCGVMGFNTIDGQNRVCEIGYWLDAEQQGKGIVTQSVSAFSAFAFDELKMNKVCIPVAVENSSSRAIPERLCFLSEGTARDAEWLYDHFVDHELYAMLHSDWLTLQSRHEQ